MTALAITLPLARVSPLYVPRRDLVLSSGDSVELAVTVMLTDDPASAPLTVTGGIGGPELILIVWRDSVRHLWDYGAPPSDMHALLGTYTGTVSETPGTFNIAIPPSAMAEWPLRCGFAIRLDYDGGLGSEMLALGTLHVRPVEGAATVTAVPITTDALEPITTD